MLHADSARNRLIGIGLVSMCYLLFALLEQDNRKQLLLSFANVEFLSSAALNKLIVLDRKLKAAGGKLALSNLRPEIQEVFAITRLNQLFEIQRNEGDALKKF